MRCGPPPQLIVPLHGHYTALSRAPFFMGPPFGPACVGRSAAGGFAGSLHKRHLSTARDKAFFLQWAV